MATESQQLSPSSWFFIAPPRLRLMQFMLIVPRSAGVRFPSRCFPFRCRRRTSRDHRDFRYPIQMPPAMTDDRTITGRVAVLLFLVAMLLACTSAPDLGWPYSTLHPDLAHKVMHAKEAAAPGQPPAESERVVVAIRVEPGQDGEEITRWLDDNGLHFNPGYVFGWPEPGFRRWLGFGSDGQNTFRASVPVLLIPELGWVEGVEHIEEVSQGNDVHGP